MRLIDADALMKKSVVINGHRVVPYLDVIEQPTAYDVEAVVVELENLNCEYVNHCTNNDWQRGFIDGAKVAIMKAISIVRGKE